MIKNTFSRIMSIDTIQRQSLVSLIWQIVFTSAGFLSTIYFAQAVGADILGAYFLFITYYSIFNMISDGGIGGAAIKRISEGEQKSEYFSAFFAVRTIFLLIAVIFLLIFQDLFSDLNAYGLVGWLPVIMIANVFSSGISIGIAGTGKMGIRATCNTITLLSSIVFQVAAIYLGYGAVGLATGMIAGLIIGGIIEYRFLDLRLVRFRWNHIESLSTFAFWLFLTSAGMIVFTQADTLMIGYFMHNSDVGIYRVVLQFTMAAAFTTNILRNTLWPRVSGWGKRGEIGLVEESLSRAISYSLILAIPVLIGGVLLGDKLLFFFYGAEFAKGYLTLMVLLAVQVVNVFQFFFTMYLDALDRPKESFKVTAVGLVANIVLNTALIPVIGIIGAAIATLITMYLNALLAKNSLSKMITIRLEHESLMNIIKATVVMGIFVGGLRLVVPFSNIWITLLDVVVGGVVYSILILKFDKKICNEMSLIVEKMGMSGMWPGWL
ncbi:MAG: flippase [Candidatus Methanoperedens sp.]|nr:flippase [Candidatus Methanoperedens sp.]